MAKKSNRDDVAEAVSVLIKYNDGNLVEVVRCKDCKKCSHDTMFGTRWCHGHEVKLDDFCSYGERSEGE